MLLRTAYPRAAMEQMAAQTPFSAWELLDDGIGFELRLVK